MAVAVADYAINATNSTPLSAVIWNSGIAPPSGNILVAWAFGNGTGATITPPTGGGWTTLSNPGQSSGTANYSAPGLFWKIASASEPTSYTWANSYGNGAQLGVAMLSFSGAVSTTPQWALGSQTSSPATSGSLTPAVINALVICGFIGDTSSNFSVASGWTQVCSYYNAVGVMIETDNTLTPNTTTAISVSSTNTGSVTVLDSYIVMVAPNITASITITDTVNTLSDTIAAPTASVPTIAITDAVNTLSDSFTLGQVIPITFTDTISTLSDSFALTPGVNISITDTVATLSDSVITPLGNINITDTVSTLNDAIGYYTLFTTNYYASTVLDYVLPYTPYIAPTSYNASYPYGIAVDGTGLNTYVASTVSNTVIKYVPGGTVALTITSGLSSPSRLTVDAAGNIYVVNSYANNITKYASTGGTPTLTISTSLTNIANSGIAVDSSGNIYVGNFGPTNIYKYASTGGSPILTIPVTYGVYGLALDVSGNIYALFNQPGTLIKYSPSGTALMTITIGTGLGLADISLDISGNIYVLGTTNNCIYVYSPTGTLLQTIPMAGTLTGGIAVSQVQTISPEDLTFSILLNGGLIDTVNTLSDALYMEFISGSSGVWNQITYPLNNANEGGWTEIDYPPGNN